MRTMLVLLSVLMSACGATQGAVSWTEDFSASPWTQWTGDTFAQWDSTNQNMVLTNDEWWGLANTQRSLGGTYDQSSTLSLSANVTLAGNDYLPWNTPAFFIGFAGAGTTANAQRLGVTFFATTENDPDAYHPIITIRDAAGVNHWFPMSGWNWNFAVIRTQPIYLAFSYDPATSTATLTGTELWNGTTYSNSWVLDPTWAFSIDRVAMSAYTSSGPGGAIPIVIDNVAINAVPEPMTLTILTIGGVAMLRKRM